MTVSATLLGTLLHGVAASRPAANAVAGGTIYSATDTGAITQSDGSSWSTFATISAGLSDPMTTRGDIIVRNASNVTARLPIGATGKVLSSDGTDVSWQTPAAGGSGAGMYDSWINRANTTTANALATISGCTREPATGGSFGNGPDGQAFLHSSSVSTTFTTFVALSGLTPGSLVRATFAAESFEGGGVYIKSLTSLNDAVAFRLGAVALANDLGGSSGVFPLHFSAAIVGSDGNWALQHTYTVGIASLIIEVIAP